MTCSSVNKYLVSGVFILLALSCGPQLTEIPAKVITQKTPHDTDDPAIWVNKDDPENSLIFGTDKDEVNGGIYAFDLKGNIISDKSITGLSYPNNIDLAYGFRLPDSTVTDVIMFTEREKNRIRLFSVPEMKELDNGGFPVFTYESSIDYRRPMGIALYQDSTNGIIYPIVSRKVGPNANYLNQYELISDSSGISLNLVRKFGHFSGEKEIEAVAVDNDLGYIYYSDEMHCVHKYYADPNQGDEEISCFGGEYFKRDIEGIAIVKQTENEGYVIISNQQAHTFSVFDRQSNEYLKEINLGTIETDGCDATTENLGPDFPNGLFVSMTDSKEFYIHDLADIITSIEDSN